MSKSKKTLKVPPKAAPARQGRRQQPIRLPRGRLPPPASSPSPPTSSLSRPDASAPSPSTSPSPSRSPTPSLQHELEPSSNNTATPPPTSPRSAPKKTDKEKLKWTARMTTTLLEAAVSESRLHRSDNGFKADVWRRIMQAVLDHGDCNAEARKAMEWKKCQDKLSNLKKNYDTWERLKNISGWGVNPATGAIVAPEEQAWFDEIEKRPEAASFRMKPLPNCFLLHEYFAGVNATGSFAYFPNVRIARAPSPGSKKRKAVDTSDDSTSTYNQTRSRRTPAPGSSTTDSTDSTATPSDIEILQSTLYEIMQQPAMETSITERAITKLRHGYKDRSDGMNAEVWDKAMLRKAARLLENDTKAGVFLGYESGEDRDEWLLEELAYLPSRSM
ncbi:hypothetical protein BJ508DRAFT_308922 [Ascobolus immersus RN42]|uniref:Myb/SANT-like domain-containing protein n=1 Tax=Ascobolus immersus RN42 TaxID=1160509 RepID=A0A3N4HY01_ASCIM|nr:hypothetical protein BJ508DRAFT_308922 [Ascobolus immersus RN42]